MKTFFITLFFIAALGKYLQILLSCAVNMGNLSFSTGFFKITHIFADTIKLAHKKLVIPKNELKFSFIIIPLWTLASSLTVWLFLPVGGQTPLINHELSILLIFSLQSFASLGFACSGLISSNYYSRILAAQKIVQMSSVIVCAGICLLGVSLNAHSFDIERIANRSNFDFFKLFPFFIIYIISAMAQNNIAPFKFKYSTGRAYSSLLLLFFRISLYSSVLASIVMIVDLFLKGGLPPLIFLSFIPKSVWFILKVLIISLLIFVTDTTFPSYTTSRSFKIFKTKLQPLAFFWAVLLYCLKYLMEH